MLRVLTLAWMTMALAVLAAAPVTVAAAADANVAKTQMMDTTDQVLKVLRDEGPDLANRPQRLYQIIDELILPHFDFRRMSGWVLGRHWRKASEAQKSQFVKAFQGLLVRTYSRALLDYRDQRIDFLKPRVRSESDVTVRAEIDQGGGPKIPVSYEMSQVDGAWKVYDVAVNGVSLVINYRSEFNQEIKRNGLEGLIRRLEKHNAKTTG